MLFLLNSLPLPADIWREKRYEWHGKPRLVQQLWEMSHKSTHMKVNHQGKTKPKQGISSSHLYKMIQVDSPSVNCLCSLKIQDRPFSPELDDQFCPDSQRHLDNISFKVITIYNPKRLLSAECFWVHPWNRDGDLKVMDLSFQGIIILRAGSESDESLYMQVTSNSATQGPGNISIIACMHYKSVFISKSYVTTYCKAVQY